MLPNLPIYLPIVFALTTILTLFLVYRVLAASTCYGKKAPLITLVLAVWLALQGGVAMTGFYAEGTTTIPPRFMLMLAPPLLAIIVLFTWKRGRYWLDSLPLDRLHYLHTVRIPVEIVLLLLYLNGAVPELMTFEGRNFDILAGITAPFVAFFGIHKAKMNRKALLAWNFVSLGLLLWIVANAILSAPFAFQQFAFDQPNVAVLYFPFNWLPAFVVPVVLFGHLVSIRGLLKEGRD